MYEYDPVPRGRFNIQEAYNQIAGAAFRFEAEGHLEIWIYLKDNVIHCLSYENTDLRSFLVANYECHKVTHNFSGLEWQRLGTFLAAVYLAHKS